MVACDPFGAGGSRSRSARSADAEASSTVGTAPRSVIRGESSPGHPATVHPFAAFTDYLTVTFPHVGGEEALKPWLVQLRSVIGDALGGLVDCKRGFLGFRHSLAFDRSAPPRRRTADRPP